VKDGLIEFFEGEGGRLGANVQTCPEEGGGGETASDAERNERDTVRTRGSVSGGVNDIGNRIECGLVDELSVDAARVGRKVVIDDGFIVITALPDVGVKVGNSGGDN
jgi:hypothetical protein